MSETIYTRGTADEGYGQTKNVKAVGAGGGQGASALQKFLSEQWEESMYGIGLRAIGRAAGSAFSSLDEATSGASSGYTAAATTAAASRTGASVEEAQAVGEKARAKEIKEQEEVERQTGIRPGLLSKSLGAVEYGWSTFVTRPASTGVMLTDPNAEIYEDGFDLKDIEKAYQRSEQVPFGRALMSSPFNPLGQTLGFDNYDVWSDSDMEAADQNPYYNFFSGASNLGLELMPLSARPLRLSFLNKIGVRSQEGLRSADDLDIIRSEYMEHRRWRESQGESLTPQAILTEEVEDLVGGRDALGSLRRQDVSDALNNEINRLEESLETITDPDRAASVQQRINQLRDYNSRFGTENIPDALESRQTGVGFLVDQVAEETNPLKILESELLRNVPGVDKVKLSNIYARTSDPDTVFSIYMAGKGDLDALADFYERAPNHVWNLAEMDARIFDEFIQGREFAPEGENFNLVNQVFDSATDRDIYFMDVRRTLVDGGFAGRFADTSMPNALWVEKIRDAAGNVRYAFKNNDYSGAPGWMRAVAGGKLGGPTTQFISWAGSRKPLGRVTRSGARPNDLIDELNSWFDSVPIFRGSKRRVTISFDADGNPVQIPASQFIAEQKARVLQAQVGGNLEGAWREMEDQVIAVMGLTMGYSARQAEDLLKKAEDLRGEMKLVEDYLEKTGGYVFSESGERILYDPQTLSMLLDSFGTTSLSDIYFYARTNIPNVRRTQVLGMSAPRVASEFFDSVSKFFRSNVLLRLGYIPKNSILEPNIAAAIAHGTILPDQGFMSVVTNFSKNRTNNIKRIAYASEVNTRIEKLLGKKGAKTRRDLKVQLQHLVAEREAALETMDLAQADLDAIKAGIVPPSVSPTIAARARARMFEAHQIIRSIEATLDGQVPQWRQVVEPASASTVSEKIRFYRSVLGEDPDYLNDLRDELGSIFARSYENSVLPSQQIQSAIDRIDGQIAAIDKRLQKLSEEYNLPSIDKTDVSVAQRQEDFVARGRDYQAIALQRQRESLVNQKDELLEEKKRVDQSGVDAFADFPMSVSDRSRAEYLQNQINRLENFQARADNSDIIPLVRSLESEYDDYLRTVDREVNVSAEQRDAMITRVEEVEEQIKEIQGEIAAKQLKVDDVTGDRVRLGAGKTDMVLNIGGEKYTISGPLADDQYALGAGWRAEVSAAQTARLNFDPSFQASYLTSRLRDAGEVEVIDRFDPRYFDELAYISNAHFRNDLLIGQILEGKSKAEVKEWLRSPEGQNYQRSMGKDYLTVTETMSEPIPALTSDRTVRMMLDSASTLDEVWDIVYAYLPTDRARKLVADRKLLGDVPEGTQARQVTGSELAVELAGEENLSRILAARGVWETFSTSSGKARIRELNSMLNRGLDKLWNFAMTMPETYLLRNPFFEREYRRQMELRGNIIAQQAKSKGLTVGIEDMNRQLEAMKQSSRRASLSEMEKTFYNIRRYSTPVYAMRFLTSFPGATFNAFYRYGRFAWREPERMLTGSLLLGDVFQVMGVDSEGNPVDQDNIGDAAYLLIPGTKKTELDAGVRVPVGSVATMFADLPMLSWLGSMSVSTIVNQNPKNDKRFMDLAKRVGLDWYYEDLFPFGPEDNPLSALFGGWQKDVWRAFRGPNDADFIRTSVQFYADSMAKWEQNGYEGPEPDFQKAMDDASAYYLGNQLQIGPISLPLKINLSSRAISKNVSPFSLFTSGPGQLMRDAWYKHREEYPNDTAEARTTFMEKHGDWARWYTYSSSEFTTYVPSSIDVYERVWEKYPNLVSSMVSVAGDDAINYINLIALDADQTFDPAVNNYLRNNPLPGDDVPVLRRIQPERFANIVRVNDGWDLYGKEVVKHEAEQARLRELRNSAPTTELADFYRDEMYREDQAWRDWVNVSGPLANNEAWQISRNQGGKDHAENAALFLSKIVNDKNFAKDEGKTDFWKNVKLFLEEREKASIELSKIRSSDDKALYKAEFRTWVRDNFLTEAPEFLPTYERYFEKEWE